MPGSTRMNKVVIVAYYHMTTMDENMIWVKQKHLLKKKKLSTLGILLYIYLFFKILNSLFECTHWRGDTSHLCTLCMLMPQKVPLLELILFYTWYEQSIPGATNSLGYVGVEVA